jgi:hypothetical protein
MKTLEQMAIDYCEPILSDDYAKSIGREDWIGTRCVRVGEGHEMYKAFLAGYNAAAPKWISVKERLPEDGIEVLFYSPKTEINCCFVGDVTHWMPLPEPPKEKE